MARDILDPRGDARPRQVAQLGPPPVALDAIALAERAEQQLTRSRDGVSTSVVDTELRRR